MCWAKRSTGAKRRWPTVLRRIPIWAVTQSTEGVLFSLKKAYPPLRGTKRKMYISYFVQNFILIMINIKPKLSQKVLESYPYFPKARNKSLKLFFIKNSYSELLPKYLCRIKHWCIHKVCQGWNHRIHRWSQYFTKVLKVLVLDKKKNKNRKNWEELIHRIHRCYWRLANWLTN